MYGRAGPYLCYTDDCCHEDIMLMEVFETLREGRVFVAQEANLPKLDLRSYHHPACYLTSSQQVDFALAELQLRINDGGLLRFVGLDVEWCAGKPMDYGVDTLQLATADGNTAVLIPRSLLNPPPRALVNFLRDAKVAKVGRNIGPDVKRLLLGHGLDVSNVIDVATRAKELKLIKRASIGLDTLARLFLKRALAGKGSMQVSRWDAPSLSDDHGLKYALLDPVASAAIYARSVQCEDAELMPAATSLLPSVAVRIYNRGCSRLAAIGVIADDGHMVDGFTPAGSMKSYDGSTATLLAIHEEAPEPEAQPPAEDNEGKTLSSQIRLRVWTTLIRLMPTPAPRSRTTTALSRAILDPAQERTGGDCESN
ncbi:hypothetical protein CTAYLR_006526 [Chrysophaeum taylorii]|uniref:3'-5' exonuclease domain-containing protein n=1 Tax=Chrysophaeum taylorii TaxID=2483200 RepID=A0AAD7UG25_9STRA|nr:hypothetical protein CTAYLR_006526 [Chrysophaeum taylorii]